jgi:hypothetical protein
MNRRTLFARLLVGAAAFVVAPAMKVEAAPNESPKSPTWAEMYGYRASSDSGWVVDSDLHVSGTFTVDGNSTFGESSGWALKLRNQGEGRRIAAYTQAGRFLVAMGADGRITYGDDLTPSERMEAVAAVAQWRPRLT